MMTDILFLALSDKKKPRESERAEGGGIRREITAVCYHNAKVMHGLS